MEKLFSKEECNNIINYLENNHTWERRVVTAPIKISYYVTKLTQEEIPEIYEKLEGYVNRNLNIILDDKPVQYLLVIKYVKGDCFGRHHDQEPTDFAFDGIYNVNVILNDDFEGGEFFLKDEKFVGNDVGWVYSYPSAEYHEVKEITNGVRYCMLFYIKSSDIKSKKTKSIL